MIYGQEVVGSDSFLTFVKPLFEGVTGNAALDSGIQQIASLILAVEGDENVGLRNDET